jgi:alkylation response protein AidB-like acyl-CoA dehydrogenase
VTSVQRLADGTFAAQLQFQEIAVSSDHLLAIGPAAEAALAAAYDEALVLAGAELASISRQMLSMTLDYLRTRKQFSKPIGSFQALQHRAVDMLIQQELCGALVAHALAELDRGCTGIERALLGARVKARCSEAALVIARESVQLHGAIGVTEECDLGLYLQRALVLSAWLGNAALQRKRFAQLSRNGAGNQEPAA